MLSGFVKLKTVLVIATLTLTLHPALAQEDTKLVYGFFWRGCEETCQGFQDYFSEAGIDAKIEIRDAAQDRSKLPGFLQEARDAGADLILTWGTTVTLGIIGTVDDVDDPEFNNDIPHVFTVVADPVGARVVVSLEATGRANVTGTFNRVPEAVNINAIRSYMPSFRRLGIIYTPHEKNSLLKRDEIAALAAPMGFELVAVELSGVAGGLPKTEDIAVKVGELKAASVDFIYLGSSTYLDEYRDIFTEAAVEAGIPILSPYERMVRNSGALMSIAARYTDVGRLAAQQAEKILVGGATPGDLPVEAMTDFAYVVNMGIAQRLNLYPPVSIMLFAETVN
jgi:putative ABC transport system substrate-binding protein